MVTKLIFFVLHNIIINVCVWFFFGEIRKFHPLVRFMIQSLRFQRLLLVQALLQLIQLVFQLPHLALWQTTIRFGRPIKCCGKIYPERKCHFRQDELKQSPIKGAPNLIGFLLRFTIVLLDFWISPRRGEKIPTNINARFHFVGKTILWYLLVENLRRHRHNFTQNGCNKCSKNNWNNFGQDGAQSCLWSSR